jgi:hypothetical protein
LPVASQRCPGDGINPVPRPITVVVPSAWG